VAGAGLTVLLALTHIPQEMMPEELQARFLDKVEHIAAYGTITFLFLRSLRRSPGIRTMLIILILGGAIGALDEITQPWVNRIASWLDFVADLVGILLACVLYRVMQWRCRERARSSASAFGS